MHTLSLIIAFAFMATTISCYRISDDNNNFYKLAPPSKLASLRGEFLGSGKRCQELYRIIEGIRDVWNDLTCFRVRKEKIANAPERARTRLFQLKGYLSDDGYNKASKTLDEFALIVKRWPGEPSVISLNTLKWQFECFWWSIIWGTRITAFKTEGDLKEIGFKEVGDGTGFYRLNDKFVVRAKLTPKGRIVEQVFVPFKPQIERAGFREAMLRSGFYEFSSETKGKIVLIYEEGKILFVGKPINIINDMGETEIISYRVSIKGGPDARQHIECHLLGLRNDYLKYEITDDGYMHHGNQELLKEIPIKLDPIQVFYDGPNSSGFVIGGVNSNEIIDKLRDINGVSIEELERRMRPPVYSSYGFLGKDEKLKAVLKKDNAFVLGNGFTHQQLAEPLFYVMNLLDRLGIGVHLWGEAIEFTYKGRRYHACRTKWGEGHQESPFDDVLGSYSDYVITDIATGTRIAFSHLLPYYIQRYGFYEGDTRYRLKPQDIINVFFTGASPNFLPPAKPLTPDMNEGAAVRSERGASP